MSIVKEVFREGAVLTDALGLNFGFPRQVLTALVAAGNIRELPMVNSVDDFHFTHGRPHPIAQMLGQVEVHEGNADVYDITALLEGVEGAPEHAYVYLSQVDVDGESYVALSFGTEERPDAEAGYASTFWTTEGLAAFATELAGLDYDNAPSQHEAE